MCVHVRRRNVSVLRCAHRRHIITRCAHVHTYVTSSHMCRTIIRGVHVHTDEGRMETGRRRARAGGQDESMRAEEHASAEGGILALGHNRRHARTTNTDVRAHAHGPSGTRTRTRCAGRLSRGCAYARVGSNTHSVGHGTLGTHNTSACSMQSRWRAGVAGTRYRVRPRLADACGARALRRFRAPPAVFARHFPPKKKSLLHAWFFGLGGQEFSASF